MAIAAVILAAGEARRFGANKLIRPLGGKPVICHTAGLALASAARPVIVVTGNEPEKIRSALAETSVQFVHNPSFSNGLSRSLKCGVKSVPPECDGALILLGDMPFVQPATLDRLISQFSPASKREIGLPLYDGRPGNPVLWSRRFFAGIEALSGDRGAKALIAAQSEYVYRLETGDKGVHIDIDTPDDLHE
jgi:Uncharacterized MobA-related protein